MESRSASWSGHYALIADFIRRMGPYEPDCLDVGGYDGPYAELFPSTYYILDNCDDFTREGIVGIHGWVKDGELVGLDPNLRFRTIVSTESLEHFDDPIRCFKNMVRHLEVGGKLIITSPSAWGYHASPKDFWRLQHDAWPYLAEKNGIDILAYEHQEVGAGAVTGFFAGIKR